VSVSTPTMPFDITYEKMDFEVVPKDAFGPESPAEAIRVVVGNHVPMMVMLGSFVMYWFVLLPFVFPATRPGTDEERKRWFGSKKALRDKGKELKGNKSAEAKTQIAAAKAEVEAASVPFAGVEKARDIHNMLLFAFSAFSCFGTAYYLYTTGQMFPGDGRIWDWNKICCTPVEGTILRPMSVAFSLSKIWEWGDTLFIIWLGSRQPIFLHKYHHATTFWLFCCVMNMPGPEKFGMLMNGGVHTMMYHHYWKRWPESIAWIITVLQMMQLAFVTYTWYLNPAECPAASFTDAPTELRAEYLTPYFMVPVFLFFFMKFFVGRFMFPAKKAKKVEAKSE